MLFISATALMSRASELVQLLRRGNDLPMVADGDPTEDDDQMVLMGAEEFQSYEETIAVLSDPDLVASLDRSLEDTTELSPEEFLAAIGRPKAARVTLWGQTEGNPFVHALRELDTAEYEQVLARHRVPPGFSLAKMTAVGYAGDPYLQLRLQPLTTPYTASVSQEIWRPEPLPASIIERMVVWISMVPTNVAAWLRRMNPDPDPEAARRSALVSLHRQLLQEASERSDAAIRRARPDLPYQLPPSSRSRSSWPELPWTDDEDDDPATGPPLPRPAIPPRLPPSGARRKARPAQLPRRSESRAGASNGDDRNPPSDG